MANQKKTQQAKNISSMGAKAGATKAQVAQGQARAGGQSGYKVTGKDVTRAGKAAKIIAGAAATAVGPGKVVKGLQVASKAIKTAQAVKKLAPEEKYAVKFVKDIAKKGKPGDLQKTMDSMPQKTKEQFGQALRKSTVNKSEVYKPTKQATPSKIKGPGVALDIKRTVTGKVKVTNTGTNTSFKLPKKTEVTQKGIKEALIKKYYKK